MKTATKQPKQTLQELENDATTMMEELSDLSGKLKNIAKDKVSEISEEVMEQMNSQLAGLQQRMQSLSEESKKIIKQIDGNVRANPYIYIICSLGLGILLGKILRSRKD